MDHKWLACLPGHPGLPWFGAPDPAPPALNRMDALGTFLWLLLCVGQGLLFMMLPALMAGLLFVYLFFSTMAALLHDVWSMVRSVGGVLHHNSVRSCPPPWTHILINQT